MCHFSMEINQQKAHKQTRENATKLNAYHEIYSLPGI